VKTPMAKFPNAGFTKSSVYYFYKRCESVPGIDVTLSLLDHQLMALMTGNSQEPCQPKILIQKRLREFWCQDSSIIGHLVSVGEVGKEMIELSKEKIKCRKESLE
jgi:hypothetical protein